jgi:hypothetical protein
MSSTRQGGWTGRELERSIARKIHRVQGGNHKQRKGAVRSAMVEKGQPEMKEVTVGSVTMINGAMPSALMG